MENDNIEMSDNFSKIDPKNLKPFLSVFVILVIIIFGYFFFWRSVAMKMKNSIIEMLDDYQYEQIKVSGFPFSKKVVVKDLSFSNKTPLITNNEVKIKEFKVSSFILSRKMDVELKDVSVLDSEENKEYNLVYNEDPEISISLYSNGDLESFNYKDNGYRVISNNNETLYTADKSEIKVESLVNGKTTDYSIIGTLQNMQNIKVLKTDDSVSETITPNAYNMDFDISSSFTDNGERETNSIIRINSVNFSTNQTTFDLNGEIIKDDSDPYSYGNLKISLKNYKDLLEAYKKAVIQALIVEEKDSSEEEKKSYSNLINIVFDTINEVIKKNPDSTDQIAKINVSREKNAKDYMINGEGFISIIQKIMSLESEQRK